MSRAANTEPDLSPNAGHDFRGWLRQAEDLGELRVLDGAHWDLEMGEITDTVCHIPDSPAVVFDNIVGYPKGYRVAVNLLGAPGRLGLAMGLAPTLSKLELARAWGEKLVHMQLLPPVEVETSDLFQNVDEGDDVDLLKFPAPRWHELDGGRYLGTGCVVITRDPDTGVVNLGTYRGMVHDRCSMGILMETQRDGHRAMRKHFERGEPLPIAVAFGTHPALFMFSVSHVTDTVSEYDYAGGLLGRPVEVVTSNLTGLPLPASAEIVVEGTITQGDELLEGPFGEWTGYYASGVRPEPVIRVQRVLHRNEPIIHGHPPIRPPSTITFYRGVQRSAGIWNALEGAGVPDVQGVWCHEAGGAYYFNVVAIKQRYPGHAKQAGSIAAQCSEGARDGRYVVVVDEDIDPTDLGQVIWAIGSRTDPAVDVEFMLRCYSSKLDPITPPWRKGFASKAIIDATRPWEWMGDFPPVSAVPNDRAAEIRAKWLPKLKL